MGYSLVPRILMPDFIWSNSLSPTVTDQIPKTPRPTHPWLRRLFGILHRYLLKLSVHYCSWVGIKFDNQIAQLPFGLMLKWSDGTRMEEVLTMQVARKAGLPVPKVISYGDHPDCPHAPMSILMTRVPGEELGQVYENLSEADRASIHSQLKGYIETMRKWKNPVEGGPKICTVLGTAIRSIRVPGHLMGPFETEEQLNDYLIAPTWSGGFSSEEKYEDALRRAKKMHTMSHSIVFAHGDLKHHNIMVHNGRISGFLDWESAGWYPEYWDFTTALRFARKDWWWYDFVVKLGGEQYLAELDCDKALNSLTVESYVW